MIFVIMPLGEAAPQVLQWLLQVAIYILASALGGALLGLLLASVGYLLGLGVWLAPPLALLALLYGLHELGVIRMPKINREWQVPNTWLLRNRWLGSAAFGLLLGAGVFTYIEFGGFYVLMLWQVALALPLLGAAVGALFGLARGLPAVMGGLLMLTGRDTISFNIWILEDAARALHFLDGLLLLFVAALLAGTLL